jgi:hypothetical protein
VSAATSLAIAAWTTRYRLGNGGLAGVRGSWQDDVPGGHLWLSLERMATSTFNIAQPKRTQKRARLLTRLDCRPLFRS